MNLDKMILGIMSSPPAVNNKTVFTTSTDGNVRIHLNAAVYCCEKI